MENKWFQVPFWGGMFGVLILTLIIPIVSAECTPNWQCTSWSFCEDNTQTRECIDKNSCLSNQTPPLERHCDIITTEPDNRTNCNKTSAWSVCKNNNQTRVVYALRNGECSESTETRECEVKEINTNWEVIRLFFLDLWDRIKEIF